MAKSVGAAFSEMANRLNKMSIDVQEEVKGLIEFHAGNIENEARRDAPGEVIQTENGTETLSEISGDKKWHPVNQSIGYKIDTTGYKATIFVNDTAGKVAAYVEFGTGQSARTYLATVPAEWKAYAQLFYINGKGTIINQPYLLPAFLKHQIIFIKEMNDLIKNLKL